MSVYHNPLLERSTVSPVARLFGQLDDLADPVTQVEFERDLIALGQTLLRQDLGICHEERPVFSLLRQECEGPLDLIDAYDYASHKGD